jgi:hypothetical protein
LPGVFDGALRPDPAATAVAVAATSPDALGHYLQTLTRARVMTPFLRELADGHGPALAALGEAVANLQTADKLELYYPAAEAALVRDPRPTTSRSAATA